MKTTLKAIIPVLAAGLLWAGNAIAADKVTIGVSIPAATHGWTGGLNFHAKEAKKRLENAYPNLKIVLVTAKGPSEQANDLEDLVSVHNIDALVILPFESAPLTEPVRQVKAVGKFIRDCKVDTRNFDMSFSHSSSVLDGRELWRTTT